MVKPRAGHPGRRSVSATGLVVTAWLTILLVAGWVRPTPAASATPPAGGAPEFETGPAPAAPGAHIDRAVAAHGGAEAWRRLGLATFEFEMQSCDTAGQPSGPPRPMGITFPTSGQAVIDATMGDVRMHYENGTTAVWNAHGEVADSQMQARAKFMLPTFQYIFSLPWKLQDEGAVFAAIAGRTDAGRALNGVRVSYRPGIGDSPDDWYKFYFDAETGRLYDVLWIITAPGHGNTIEWCRFEDQRLVQGVWLPHQWTFVHAREDGEPLGPPGMRARLVRVSFTPAAGATVPMHPEE